MEKLGIPYYVKVQEVGKKGYPTYIMTIPKPFADKLGIRKGTYLKVTLQGDKMIVEVAK